MSVNVIVLACKKSKVGYHVWVKKINDYIIYNYYHTGYVGPGSVLEVPSHKLEEVYEKNSALKEPAHLG